MEKKILIFLAAPRIARCSLMTSSIEVGASDKRVYRTLTLENGLSVLLISDPETDKSESTRLDSSRHSTLFSLVGFLPDIAVSTALDSCRVTTRRSTFSTVSVANLHHDGRLPPVSSDEAAEAGQDGLWAEDAALVRDDSSRAGREG